MTYGPDILTGGTPVACSFSPDYPPALACDDNESTIWMSNDGAAPHWWGYDLGEGISKKVKKLRIKTSGGGIKDFSLLGSNDMLDFPVIYSNQQANNTDWQEYTFDNENFYRYYVVYIATVWDTDGIIAEVEMMESLSDFIGNGVIELDLDSEQRQTEKIIGNGIIEFNLSSTLIILKNLILNTNFITRLEKSKIIQTILNIGTIIFNKINTDLRIMICSIKKIHTELRIQNPLPPLPPEPSPPDIPGYDYIQPKKLSDIIVMKDGSELTDVDYSTLRIQLNLNSTPSNATFVLARRHDDLDHLLDGITDSQITNKNKIQIYDGGILLFTGYISKINAISSSDTVEIIAEDIRCKINEITVSLYYGGYNATQINEEEIETVYYSVADAISYVLGVAGLSGSLEISLIPESTYFTGNCCAALDTLIGNSINANWYIDANENFQIQKVAMGTVKTLSLSSINAKREIYDVILNDILLNKLTNNYTPNLKVKLGKEIINTWINWTGMSRNYYLDWIHPITYEYDIPAEHGQPAEHVIIRRDNFIPEIDMDTIITEYAQEKITEDLNYLKNELKGQQEPQIFVIQDNKYTGNTVNLDKSFITVGFFSENPLVSVTYKLQYKLITYENDLPYIIIGSGSPQKELNLSQFGYKHGNGQMMVVNGKLGYQYEESYDYRGYALDLANYELSQNNKPLTEASIALLLDAYEYYGLNLSDLINLSNTTLPNIYNNINGFPLNISGVNIDCATRVVTLNATNYGKSFYQRSGDYRNNYYFSMFIGYWDEYVPEE